VRDGLADLAGAEKDQGGHGVVFRGARRVATQASI